MDTNEMFNDSMIEEEFSKGYDKAEEMLNDEDKMERLFQRLEKKLKKIPALGDKLAVVPQMFSLVRSYYKKEYTDVPLGSILGCISALIYFVSVLDLIPDGLPIVGLLDDAAVVVVCWNCVKSDIEDYLAWRDRNGKTIEDI